MILQFDGRWRFTPPQDGQFQNQSISSSAVDEFFGIILRVSSQGDSQTILEHFKGHFSIAIGTAHVRSSNERWAQADLKSLMEEAAAIAPMFIDVLYDGLHTLSRQHPEYAIPTDNQLNEILTKHNIGYEIVNNELRLRDQTTPLVRLEIETIEREQDTMDILLRSISLSEDLLSQGRAREAVQESLWLLETISTAFRGQRTSDGTVQGRFFNQIIQSLRTIHRGTTLDRVLQWAESLYGYLSSPTGGGVRHGLDLTEGQELSINEARLFCNLIRSYTNYLISEYRRIEGHV